MSTGKKTKKPDERERKAEKPGFFQEERGEKGSGRGQKESTTETGFRKTPRKRSRDQRKN